jgi:hypothetical protein
LSIGALVVVADAQRLLDHERRFAQPLLPSMA